MAIFKEKKKENCTGKKCAVSTEWAGLFSPGLYSPFQKTTIQLQSHTMLHEEGRRKCDELNKKAAHYSR